MAAGNETAALVVALSAQLTKFEKDLDKAGQIADKEIAAIEAKFRATNFEAPGFEAFVSKIKALATGGAIGLIVRQLEQLNAAAAKIGETAELVGASTDELQKFRYAVVATGGSIQGADSFLEHFSRKVAEAAQGSGDLYNFLRANNIAASEFVKLPLNQQLERFADLVKNTASSAQRLNEVFMVGGRQAGPQITSALAQGAEGLRRFGEEAKSSGAVVDKELIERARRINTEFEKLKLTFSVTAQEVAVSTWDLLARSIGSVSSAISEFLNQFEALKKLREEGQSRDLQGTGFEAPGVGFVPDFDALSGRPRITISKPSEPVPLPRSRPTDIGNGSTRQIDLQADSFDKLIKSQEKRIALLGVEQDAIGRSAGAEAFYRTTTELTNRALEQNIPLTDARIKKITEEAIKTAEATQSLDDYRRQWRGLNEAVQFAGDQLINVLDGLRNKTLSLNDAARNLANSLIHALEQAVLLGQGPLAGVLGLGSNTAGGTGGLLGALLQGFGGPKAGGGDVSGGRAYLVGERGAELFVPSNNGRIIPNAVLNSAPSSRANVQINNYVAADTETRQRSQNGPDGETLVVDIIKKRTARGDFDDVNRARFGLRANKVR